MAACSLAHGRAQVIPTNRTFGSAWRSAGCPQPIPSPSVIVNVRSFGAQGNGATNDQPAVAAAIAALGGAPGVVFFPVGTYLLQSAINLPSGAVLRGQRATNTTLRFDIIPHCINISGQLGAAQAVVSGYTIHSRSIEVTDGSVFAAGDYAEIRQANDPAWPSSVWSASMGQGLRIAGRAGNTLALENPLRGTYRADLSPEIRKVIPVVNAGVENLKVERLLAGTATDRDNQCTIWFSYSAEGWVRGVEGYNGFGGHVGLSGANRISVTGCYFHHAHDYDGGGSGYGVRAEGKAGECLVENNIFEHLRHAMLLQAGANGNVFGYNYSRDPYWVNSIDPSDLSGDLAMHQNYPYANLFEGNICQHLWIDDSHNPNLNGPLNTYFRNRAELHGLNMTDSRCNDQNFVGNETFKGGTYDVLRVGDGYRLQGTGHFEYGNNTKSDGLQPPNTGDLSDFSYYLNDNPTQPPPAPAFWTITNAIPTVGPPLALDPAKIIPARARWLAGGPLTVGPPSLARQPEPQTVDERSAATFSVEAYGTPAAQPAWHKNGTPLPGATNAILTIPSCRTGDAGNYSVVVRDDYGSVTSTVVTLTVNPAPPPSPATLFSAK